MSSSSNAGPALEKQPPVTPNVSVALTTVTIVFGGTLALMAPFVILSSTKKRPFSPYIATPSRKLRRAFEYISTRTATSSGHDKQRRFLDLGSGDGESVYQAVKAQQQQSPLFRDAVGVELNSTLYFLSQLRRYAFWKSDERQRSAFYCRDMWKFSHHFSTFDTIFVSQIPAVQSRLGKVLAQECQPGTLLLSYRFHGMMGEKSLRAKLLYDDNEHTRIYEILVKDQDPSEETKVKEPGL